MIDMSKYTLIRRTLSGLSLAVHLQDKSARLPAPAGRIEVILKKFNRKAVKNPSGYHVYLALEDGDYEVQIDSDFYLPKSFTVAIPDPGTSSDDEITFVDLGEAALAEVALVPDVSYPFSSGATLVRGQVVESSGDPVPQALINILDDLGTPSALPVSFHANAKGQFVLFGNKLTKLLIKEINGKPYEGSRNLRIRAEHPQSGTTAEGTVLVEDFKTVYLTITF